MKTSESIVKIAPALLAAQKEMSAVKKGAKNPFFKSNYADLPSVIEAVKDALNNHGIVYIQSVDGVGSDAFVETRLLHESGEWLASTTPVLCKDMSNPQALGSGITYSKRYALQAICGLPTADDDAEGAMNRDGGPTKISERQKPPVDPARMTSGQGRRFIADCRTAQEAIDEVRKAYTVNEEMADLIMDIWDAERQVV
jgi:hypothetical protein